MKKEKRERKLRKGNKDNERSENRSECFKKNRKEIEFFLVSIQYNTLPETQSKAR